MSQRTKNILTGIVIVIVLIGGWYFSTRNKLITLKESTTSSWAQVENQLQRRFDLIPNLVQTAKGVAKHEKTVFENIANARAKLAGAQSFNEKVAASGGLQSALSRLLLIVENYPNLKSNQQFQRLMDSLEGTENRIAVERRRYNENVKLYNLKVMTFPSSFVAKREGYDKLEYFKVDETAKKNVKVQF